MRDRMVEHLEKLIKRLSAWIYQEEILFNKFIGSNGGNH